MLRTAEYQRGYDAGYKQGLLDALANTTRNDSPTPFRRGLNETRRKLSENGC
jgi:hypothetical protein